MPFHLGDIAKSHTLMLYIFIIDDKIYHLCTGMFVFCRDLQLEEFVDLYWRDYPSLINGFNESCLIDQSKTHLIV